MFHIKENNTIKYITSDIFDDGNFIHAFSTRISGNDKNFALMDKSNPQDIHIKENRQKFCSIFNIDPKSLVIPEQTHSSNIKIIKDNIPQLQNTDGIIITTPGITGMLFFADCTPVILYSKRHKTYALIHAGWKGTASSISAKTARRDACPPREKINDREQEDPAAKQPRVLSQYLLSSAFYFRPLL